MVAAFLLLWADAPAPATQATQPPIPKHFAKILAKGDGKSPQTAYRVSSVRDEYAILRILHLKPESQALVVKDGTFDVMTVTDPESGQKRDVWFDIRSFFGRGF